MKNEKPTWLKFNEDEVETIVLKLARQGITSEKIGLILRDQYGIPSAKVFGKKIGEILKKAKIEWNADIINLKKKIERTIKHTEKNKHDYPPKRKLVALGSKVKNLEKYHEKKGI